MSRSASRVSCFIAGIYAKYKQSSSNYVGAELQAFREGYAGFAITTTK